MSKDKKEKQAVKTAEQPKTEFVKQGATYVEVPVTPAVQPPQESVSEPEPEISLINHPDIEISELARSIEASKGGIVAVKSDGNLTEAQRNIRINGLETDIKAKTLAIRDRLFMKTISGDISLFLNLIKFRAGQMFQVSPDKFGTFLSLVETAKSDWKDRTVREQMVESNESILNYQSEIVKLNALIKVEQSAQAELMEKEFFVNPIKVAVEFPDQLQRLTGKVYANNIGKPAQISISGQAKQTDIGLGDKEGVPDADHKEMLSVTTKENVQEAINSGVDSQSNVDIAHWISTNKLGRDMPKYRHTIASSIYVHRKALGYA